MQRQRLSPNGNIKYAFYNINNSWLALYLFKFIEKPLLPPWSIENGFVILSLSQTQ